MLFLDVFFVQLSFSMREKNDTKLENLGKHGNGDQRCRKIFHPRNSRLGLFSLEKRCLGKDITKRFIEFSYGLHEKSRKE